MLKKTVLNGTYLCTLVLNCAARRCLGGHTGCSRADDMIRVHTAYLQLYRLVNRCDTILQIRIPPLMFRLGQLSSNIVVLACV